MIQQKAVISNSGPIEAIFDDVVVGSSLQFSFLFEEEVTPGVWTPMDLSGFTFVSEVRRDLYSPDATATLDAVPRGSAPGDVGWIDFKLGASATAAAGQCDLHWSFKSIPTASPEDARTPLFGTIPLRYRGTR